MPNFLQFLQKLFYFIFENFVKGVHLDEKKSIEILKASSLKSALHSESFLLLSAHINTLFCYDTFGCKTQISQVHLDIWIIRQVFSYLLSISPIIKPFFQNRCSCVIFQQYNSQNIKLKVISWQNGQNFCWIYANLVWKLTLDFEYPGGLWSQICVLHPQVSKRSSVQSLIPH